MNKPYIDHVIIVEGSSDKAKILSLFDAYVFLTNGYDIDKDLITFISKYRQIILLTDSDEAGKQIRERVNNVVKTINVEVDISKCDKHHKHGVAECSLEELNKVLSPFVCDKPNRIEITNTDLYLWNVDKDKLKEGLDCPNVSNKLLLDLINIAELTHEDLIKYENR